MSETSAPHVAVVTGANAGIGAATALALGRRGVSVLVAFFRPKSISGRSTSWSTTPAAGCRTLSRRPRSIGSAGR